MFLLDWSLLAKLSKDKSFLLLNWLSIKSNSPLIIQWYKLESKLKVFRKTFISPSFLMNRTINSKVLTGFRTSIVKFDFHLLNVEENESIILFIYVCFVDCSFKLKTLNACSLNNGVKFCFYHS
ncbi:hypothetical protein [Mycoplasmopsis verecunda]|uniref:hypothetical protein n=1 Tax=Mycoplasmopsis verecunda TaxID=171291 RepID=UPI00117F51C3|nr:hypothetical protein [Mycoplasmopsis verecunda]WPB54271.1 hypothetical protein SAM46_02165 [Mycoplasmopsis verecunda]